MKLPVYLKHEEFKKLLKATWGKHHKVAFVLAYASGLRVSEITKLQPQDIDIKSKRVYIRQGKGGKDRVVPLPIGFPESWLELFPLKCGVRALQITFKRTATRAGVDKPGLVFHSLRHSFAVHCMEQKIPLNHIQVLLGHENLQTTSIYTKVNPQDALESYFELF